MKREIRLCCYTIDTTIQAPPDLGRDDAWWLKQAEKYGLTTLLAHADDGVIWGKVEGGKLKNSGQLFSHVSPTLRPETLRQARLFGEKAELLLWRDGDGVWHARLLQDEDGVEEGQYCFDEPQVQWGDHVEEEKDGFTLVVDGQQGLRHAVPLSGVSFDELGEETLDRWHPLRLGVRHYLQRNQDDGSLTIVQSRLTRLYAERREEVDNA